MKPFKFSMSHTLYKILIIVLIITTKQATEVAATDIGVVFSPLVRKGDGPNTQTYTRNMVKVMLNVLLDAGYKSVTTYGVGSPGRSYDNQSISDSSSFVHTAVAAAEINKDRNDLVMTVYQGLYHSISANQVNCEVEVGLEMALQANRVFKGTVPAIVSHFGRGDFNDLIDNIYINSIMKNVSVRTRSLNIKYGVRVSDCQDILARNWNNVQDVMSHCDFIICLVNPDENKFKFGYDNFKNTATFIVLQAEEYIFKKYGNSTNVELILETGWPGDPALQSPIDVQGLIEYWKDITNWALQNGRPVFLHEAFDTPWKDEHPEWPLAAHFGRWEYNTKESNLLSNNAYILKHDFVLSFLGNLGLPHIGILLGVAALLVLLTMITLLYKRVQRIEVTTIAPDILNEKYVKMFFDGISDDSGEYIGDIWDKSPYEIRLELHKNQIKMDTTDTGLLGKGQFGCVYKGDLFLSDSQQEVAVKTIGSNCSHLEIKCILSEIKMLTYVGLHAHICSILGAYTKEISKGIVYFALELCALGSMEGYLQKNKLKFEKDLNTTSDHPYVTYSRNDTFILSDLQLVRWSYEVASAMNFIGSKNVIHADLAARNILLTAEYTTKVTDFGLSRRFLDEDPSYAKSGPEPLPWKWLAPESLEFKTFSTKSDVWAYGVTLWEIFSLGSSPRYHLVRTWSDLISHLKTGSRLEQPMYASDAMYHIMKKSWELEPSDRLSFAEILQSLVLLIDSDYRDLAENENI